jgi:hypothetical protein
MKVIRTNSTRLELLFAELHTMLPIPKGGEISEIEVDNRGRVLAVWLKDTEIVRDLADKGEPAPTVNPAPSGGGGKP